MPGRFEVARRSVRVLSFAFLLVPGIALAGGGHPGPGDWGDAPEGVLAYPASGVGGAFPTCFGGPAGFIYHGNPGPAVDMYWGFTVDDEIDGNAGLCPSPPYELDECWGPFDGDGGLASPAGTFTITAGTVVPCGPTPPVPLGQTCQVLTLFPGGPFEANLVNNSGQPGFVNVLFDWDQDGRWGGASACGGLVPEHAIVNLPVPPFYAGPLSGLSPGPVQIGPNAGYVWVRLSIMNQPVLLGWDGSGLFDLGETEDYLLRIDASGQAGEYGDAPEGALAYPGSGVIGDFPTCIAIGPTGFVFHAASGQSYFGPFVDYEGDGNATTCPQPPYDLDECGLAPGNDAGLLFPTALSVTPVGSIIICPNAPAGVDWTGCFTAKWGVDVDILVTNNSPDDRYVNVLADWDGDGKWAAVLQTCPQGNVADEHVLVDFAVPAGYSGALSALGPPDFTIGAPADGMCWTRFTVSDTQVGAGWGGAANFGDGETEDYLFRIARPPVDAPELGQGPAGVSGALRVDSVQPNPARAGATLRFVTARPGHVTILVYDSAGRRVALVEDGPRDAGVHTAAWDGRDARGLPVTPGVYFVRTGLDADAVTAKLVVVR